MYLFRESLTDSEGMMDAKTQEATCQNRWRFGLNCWHSLQGSSSRRWWQRKGKHRKATFRRWQPQGR